MDTHKKRQNHLLFPLEIAPLLCLAHIYDLLFEILFTGSDMPTY